MRTISGKGEKVKKFKVVLSVVLAVALAAAAVLIYHRKAMKDLRAELSEEQQRKALLEQRVNDISAELVSSNQEKESLSEKIEELLADEVILFDSAVIMEEIENIAELATLEYRYTNVGTLDSSMQFAHTGITIPFSTKSAVITMDGIIKVGIDVNGIGITSNELTKTITVTVPDAKLLSNELVEDSIQIYDEKNGLFNKLTIEDGSTLRDEIKMKAAANAEANGVYLQAEKNVESVLRCMIEAAPGGRNYQIEFK